MNYIINKVFNNLLINNKVNDDPDYKNINVNSSYSYYDIIYNNIHIIDNYFDAGFITTETNYVFEIWNTFEENKVLNSINFGDITGVNINNVNGSPLELPKILLAKSSELYQLNLTTEGAEKSSGNILINISDLNVPIYVNLTRTFIFDYELNLANNIIENYNFKTEVIESINSNETRYSYIKNPRYSTTYFYTLENKEKRMLDKVLYSASTGVLTVPLYIYPKLIESISGNIINVDIENTPLQVGMTVLIKDNNKKDSAKIIEIINNNSIRLEKEISSDFDYPILYPLINTRIDLSNSSSNLTNYAATYTITFTKEIDDIDMLKTNNSNPIKLFNDIPLLDIQVNTIDPHEITFFKNVTVIDDSISKRQFKVNNEISKVNTQFNFVIENKNKISDIKNFFSETQGMFKEFYFFSNKQDFFVIENISSSDTILTVENESLSAYYKNKYIKHAVIFYNDTYKIITINDIYSIDKNREAIVLNSNFGINLEKDLIQSCQLVYRSRFSDDLLTLNYEDDNVATLNISILKLNKE